MPEMCMRFPVVPLRAIRTTPSTRTYLIFSNISVLLPALAFIAAVLWHFSYVERRTLEDAAAVKVREAVYDLDREIAGWVAALRGLARDESLTEGDFRSFQARARTVLRFQSDTIVLSSPDGTQLANTAVPWGRPLPESREHETQARAVQSREASVSGVFEGPLSGEQGFNITVPVLRGGAVVYTIKLFIPAVRVQEILLSRVIPRYWAVGVLDGSDRVIAHTVNPGLIGRPPAPAIQSVPVTVTPTSGVYVFVRENGERTFSSYQRIERADWTVCVGIPVSVLEAPIRRSWMILGVFGLGLGTVTLLGVFAFSRRLEGAIDRLAVEAPRIVAGEPVAPEPTHVVEIDRVFTALRGAAQDLRWHSSELRRNELMRGQILDVALDGVITVDSVGRVIEWNRAAERMFGYTRSEALGRDLGELVLPEAFAGEAVSFSRFLRDRSADRTSRRVEMEGRRSDGTRFPLELAIGCFELEGEPVLTAYVRDIAEAVETKRELTDAAERNHLLMRETMHRSKNLLTIVQGIVRQTAQRSATIAEFERGFERRLQGLAATQSLLVQTEWVGVPLRDLIDSQLGHYASEIGSRIVLEGPNVTISAEAAQNLGLALHELSSNATKYGALSNIDGEVFIRWTVSRGTFEMEWREVGGPEVKQPARKGFGTRVIERVAANAFSGRVSVDYAPEGFRWRLMGSTEYFIDFVEPEAVPAAA